MPPIHDNLVAFFRDTVVSCPSFWISQPLDSEQKPQTKQWCQLSKTVTWQDLPPVRNVTKETTVAVKGIHIIMWVTGDAYEKKPSERNLPRTTPPFWLQVVATHPRQPWKNPALRNSLRWKNTLIPQTFVVQHFFPVGSKMLATASKRSLLRN